MKTVTWLSPCIGASIVIAAALPQPTELEPRGGSPIIPGLGSLITGSPLLGEALLDDVAAILGGIGSDFEEGSLALQAVASVISAAKPTARPADVTQAQAQASNIFASYAASGTPNIAIDAVQLITNGFTTDDLSQIASAGDGLQGADSHNSTNTRTTEASIFPRASDNDAPFSLAENLLKGTVFIPDTFTYGKSNRVPLLLVPGTGAPSANVNFKNNILKLFSEGGPGADIADPVLVNIPGAVLGDIQVNAEYVAYAINYISALTGKKVAVATWSQGCLEAGWALQYWPSTRAKVVDLINYSSDYHGTAFAYALNPGFPKLPSTPSVIQQEYNSTFISTFRNGGGSSAYVPTTTIYSAFFDEVVEPQTLEGASAFIQDARNVGVSNSEIQSICSGKLGGGFYTHEGVLYNPLAYALTVDALTHDGPGLVSRLDLQEVCNEIVTPGLGLIDVLETEAIIPIALLEILAYGAKVFDEPPIMPYAQS